MKIDKTKTRRKRPPFRPSIKTSCKQIFVIFLILGFIAAVPITFEYFRNPEREPIGEVIKNFSNILSVDTNQPETQVTISIPLINKDVDVSIFKQNPQLLTFTGLGSVFIALIIGITLIRSSRKK